jgi:hypothetical protein
MSERYTPTQLEWLVLSVEAKIPMVLSQLRMLHNLKTADDVRVFFKAKEPDTVVAFVRCLEGVEPAIVRLLDVEIERIISEIASGHGWEKWVKIEWDVPRKTG